MQHPVAISLTFLLKYFNLHLNSETFQYLFYNYKKDRFRVKRVAITGLNIVTSLGLDINESWENILKGKSGIKKISLFDASSIQTQIAGEITGFDEYAESIIKKRAAKQMTRTAKLCYTCASVAVEKSIPDFSLFDKTRCAVILGVVNSGYNSIEAAKNNNKDRIIMGMNNALPAWISLKYGIQGPSYSVATACASSAYAITLAYDMIKNGSADIVITGGADSTINPEEINGFNELYALSTNNANPEKASRPFTKERDGFVIGEGAGILILESFESAEKRGAKMYAEMTGYANTSECYNIMAPEKDGEGMAKTMSGALRNSALDKEKINYINAHGTSTTLNDKYETMAIKKVFGDYAYKIPVSSTKSMIGHTIGAAGAIEGAVTVMSIFEQTVPPTINYDEPDPELDLDYVPNNARKQDIGFALSNSFAFGGHNSSLIFKKI
jgi:3-oxoacyl-[acyl-carrier-protein] synthase II